MSSCGQKRPIINISYVMRVILKTIFLAVCVFFSVTVQAEEITSFTVTYDVQPSGLVQVEEIIVYDFAGKARRGILRMLAHKHAQPASSWFKERFVAIENVYVERAGAPEPFVITELFGETELRIGDPDVLYTGPQTYRIKYDLRGALSAGPAGAEFYWNVTGNEWPVPIELVDAMVRVSAPGMLLPERACYRGVVGDTTRCDITSTTETAATFTALSLPMNAGLTIAQALNADVVVVTPLERWNIHMLGYLFALLWLIGFSWWGYRYRTEHKTDKPVVAQYEPYKDLLPVYTGVLFDGNLDPHDITAGIVYLAKEGYLSIKKTEEKVLLVFNTTDYEITARRTDRVWTLPPMLQEIHKLIFGYSVAENEVVRISSLARDQVRNAGIVQKLRNSAFKELEQAGYFFAQFGVRDVWQRVGYVLVGVFFIAFMFDWIVLLITVGLTLFVLAMTHYKRRTQKGFEARNHLEGFKLFLSVTDKERFDFHNAPEKSPELFMEYLPYAIALKVEDKWSKVFADVMIPNPEWYDGGSLAAFNAASFTSDIGAFSNTFTAASGTSGSSGGGASGGGGGGGGGGSW